MGYWGLKKNNRYYHGASLFLIIYCLYSLITLVPFLGLSRYISQCIFINCPAQIYRLYCIWTSLPTASG